MGCMPLSTIIPLDQQQSDSSTDLTSDGTPRSKKRTRTLPNSCHPSGSHIKKSKSDETLSTDVMSENSMSCGEVNDTSPLRVSNFGASNGFNKGPSHLSHGKPGSVKKLIVKNQKGEVL